MNALDVFRSGSSRRGSPISRFPSREDPRFAIRLLAEPQVTWQHAGARPASSSPSLWSSSRIVHWIDPGTCGASSTSPFLRSFVHIDNEARKRDFLRQETCESETSQGHARVSWVKFRPIEGRTGFGNHVDVGLTSAMPEKKDDRRPKLGDTRWVQDRRAQR